MKCSLDKKTCLEIGQSLSHYIADSFILYVKTLNYHWNMTGTGFFMYHRLLEEQYKEMAEAIDVMAERLRMINIVAPATMKEYLSLSSLIEGKSHQSERKMVEELAKDNMFLVEHGSKAIKFCQDRKDEATADILIDRIRAHDKNSWLLRSHLSHKR